MLFLLQTVDGKIKDVEVFNLMRILDHYSVLREHSYILCDSSTIEGVMDYIPVGDLDYVGDHLKKNFGITKMNPIEIPKEMRNKNYVGRYYKILRKEDLPDRGFSFVKDVSKLKVYAGLMAISDYTRNFLTGEVYQISDAITFISEYRVFVLNGEVQAIQHYRDDVLVFPDVNVIKQIINDYIAIEGSAKAFTVDVGIDDKGRTLLIEIHNFNSCGTYGFESNSLLEMYSLGYKYLIESNKPLELDEINQ